jgi:hypothetical protein
LSERERRRGCDEHGNDGSFQGFLPGMRPRRPNSRCERKCDNEAHRFPTAPRGISHPRRGRSPGLWDRCVSPSRELALPVAGPRVGHKSPESGCWLIRPRHLPLRGQQRTWKDCGSRIQAGANPSESSVRIRFRTTFPFHPGARHAPGHLERAR